MDRVKIAVTSAVLLLFAASAHAQNVSGGATGAAGAAVGGVTGGVTSGLGGAAGPGAANPYSALNDPILPDSSNTGGDVSGGLGVKVGDRLIKFRGAVGVGQDRSDFKAGAAIPLGPSR